MTHYQETGTYLDRILARTIETVASSKHLVAPAEMARRAQDAQPPVALDVPSDHLGVIAEFKRASPSKGRFPAEIDPAQVAQEYVNGGATAISCLTDTPFFQGSMDDLEAVVDVAGDRVPVLRKDFTIDAYQIDEARAHGASVILLIAAVLDDVQLSQYRLHVEELGMQALVEIHDESEAERATHSGATLIGINNRNLKTFVTDLATSERLTPLLPKGATIVGESGIHTRQDAQRMADAGCHLILVGESLILQSDRVAAVRELTSVRRG